MRAEAESEQLSKKKLSDENNSLCSRLESEVQKLEAMAALLSKAEDELLEKTRDIIELRSTIRVLESSQGELSQTQE